MPLSSPRQVALFHPQKKLARKKAVPQYRFNLNLQSVVVLNLQLSGCKSNKDAEWPRGGQRQRGGG